MSFLVACAMMNCLNFLKFAEAEAVAFAMMWNFLCWGSDYDDEIPPYCLWASKLERLVYHIQATSLEVMWLQWAFLNMYFS
jgi:hypothetical protein